MKKLGALFVLLSAVSFADYNSISSKFQKLEKEYAALLNTENREFEKIAQRAQNAEQQLQEKLALKASLEDRISRMEQVSSSKFFQKEYVGIVKEYKAVLGSLDKEIADLNKIVSDYNAIQSLKGGL